MCGSLAAVIVTRTGSGPVAGTIVLRLLSKVASWSLRNDEAFCMAMPVLLVCT